jgi:hypothetical protein
MLSSLLQKAASASPDLAANTLHKWASLWPVYHELRKRGFSCSHAVDWLVKEGAMIEADRAMNAFNVITTRRKKQRTGARSE